MWEYVLVGLAGFGGGVIIGLMWKTWFGKVEAEVKAVESKVPKL